MKRTIRLLSIAALTACVVPANNPPPQPAPRPVAQPPQPPPPVAQPAPQPQPAPRPPPTTQPPPPPVAQPAPRPQPPRPPRPTAPAWDSTGWTLLGTKWVDGKVDRDVVSVGVKNGTWSKITVVVSESSLVMDNVKVVFGNNSRYSPKLRHRFAENSRTRAINLPGKARKIKRIAFRYRNLPGGGRAKVAVYGKAAPVATPNPPPLPPTYEPTAPSWNNTGWTKLGQRAVNGRRDRDIMNTSGRGTFTHLTLVVSDSDLEMFDVIVTFGNGKTFSPKLRHTFKNGTRSRAINLPGHRRNIKKIEFRYGNYRGGKRATISAWGIDKSAKIEPPKWQGKGWTKLGEKWVNGKKDRDIFNLRNRGAWTHLTVVVSESDLSMDNMKITFGNKQTHQPKLRHVFKNGSRSQAINLPGHRRNIKKIEFNYGNLPGSGRAKVAIYGQNRDPKPTKPAFNPRGWTKVGTRTVNGNRDKDTFSPGSRGAFTHLTFVVSESDLRVYDMEITFGNGSKHSPKIAHVFKNGARSRSINLPGHQRNIKTIKFKYGNLPGTGRAKLTVYGKNTTAKPSVPAWKAPDGWAKLGEQWVSGKKDKDVFRVGRKRGVFSKLMVVVSESDLRMQDLIVTFGNKQTFRPKLKHIFKNGARSRAIDLPGNVRNIQKIEFKYGNLPGTGRAKVAVWAKPGNNPANDKPVKKPGWSPKGWSKLGSKSVQKKDVDSISVGTYAKAWSSLAFQVVGGDVYVNNITVTFGNGDKWSPKVRHLFKDGSRSRAIKLPKKRKIKKVKFSYGKKNRKGKAKVHVWAQ